MNTDPGILCFSHCGTSIFCLQLPGGCPICQQSLTGNSVTPFRIPYPFVRARQTTCAVIMKPSTGTFLNCYSMNSDLHVGISSSTGKVFEFDFKGLNSSNADAWNQCLVIYHLQDSAWYPRWNDVLQSVYNQIQFSSETYNEDTHNCYTFVMAFIRELRHSDFKNAADSKEMFCQNFVIPRLKEAIKYVSLFRNVKKFESVGFWNECASSNT